MSGHDPNDKLLDYLVQRVEKMDEKIDVLMKNHGRILVGALVTSFFVTLFVQLAQIFYSK